MSKYKVGEELIIIENQHEDVKKLSELIELKVNKENYSKLTLGIKILEVKYDKPNVILTYRNVTGDVKKVFAICRDIPNFDEEKVLEKALLKAFQEEIINLNVTKNQGIQLKY
ncbi:MULTISPECIES: hypothetical protein [Clostridium]|uniref:Uncharacterized protein n=2 Tax=Clostridium novyi TaxID=1542 RepID=A0Q0J6_CLONN|nr:MULTISPECIES: hypothetical protein [Clostridium]ABK60752.1 conserved hypothetical protein [Clostridium novyi NT]KEH85427.1 hypothetical protein Z966_07120 [Clostridium novyi A str. NCTC 538]KEH85536.1 hypothetical protein Z967_08740 [Clostridium novyi A str. 4540]KEH88144.1 hypothetical protein Z965_05065 [Clostridium novyi A str. BKT29909]KEH91448.1 hypothetical protein Z964_09575 [Clostridium novyi A str. GD211209]